MIPHSTYLHLQHQRLWLLPQKAVYWQKKKILILADLHVGKTGHFRKHGIPVPNRVNQTNLGILNTLIERLSPDQLVVVGDLFHSDINKEWKVFEQWRKSYRQLEFSLVLGNHDILPDSCYHSTYINLFKRLRIDPFVFVHDPDDLKPRHIDNRYPISGHIHPAVQLKGKGRQSMKLPCFYFGEEIGIMPAFGTFTGTHVIRPSGNDRVYGIVNRKVVNLN